MKSTVTLREGEKDPEGSAASVAEVAAGVTRFETLAAEVVPAFNVSPPSFIAAVGRK